VKYITRFTEDCFASLVALIFIYDAIREILKIRRLYPVNYRPDILLDYSCSCIFTDIGVNETNINDTVVVDYLFHGHNLNKTSQIDCMHAGGFVVGSGCATPVYHADIFFYSVLLFVVTFFICMALQEFRHSSFFSSRVCINNRFFFVFYSIGHVHYRFERFSAILLYLLLLY
jgi:solute carrier family 4 (sodium bicarbonate cotransporter), member 7